MNRVSGHWQMKICGDGMVEVESEALVLEVGD